MPYISTFNRNQMMVCSWDSFVSTESIARLIDAFVDNLDSTKYGVREAAKEGRPGYAPKGMYKLYIYGSRKGIRSSRKLAESCKINLEVKWMLGGAEPDFRTISDFRKDNIVSLKEIFHEFNQRISGAVKWGFTSIDGSKFLANNSKDSNFTKNKLDDRIKWLDDHTDEYFRILKDMDEQEDLEEAPDSLTKEMIEAKLKETQERLARYKCYQKLMEETGVSQLSLTDADARLMKNKNGFAVAYNPQTAVDSETHLIHDFQMTNQVTDHGLLHSTMEGIRGEKADKILEAVADKGYKNSEDMIRCLENGIIPHVILDAGKDGYELEIPYEETEPDISSTKPEELKKSLHAGRIPEAYKDVISNMEIKTVRRKVEDVPGASEAPKSVYGTAVYGRPKASTEYIFVRSKAPYGKLTGKVCTKALYRILPERKDVKGGGFHVTRRTFATNLLRNHAEIDDVMDALGHRDPTSVMKYLLLDVERSRKCGV